MGGTRLLCEPTAAPGARGIVRPSAGEFPTLHPFLRAVWCSNGRGSVSEPHVTTQSCTLVLNPLLWEGCTFSLVLKLLPA